MRKFLMAVIAVMLMVPVFAQDELEATLGTDLVSGYIWRGQKLGSVSLQPTTGLSWKGLSLNAWGNFAIAPNEKYEQTDEEIDITLDYAFSNFHIGVTDFYNFNCGHPYFKYGGLGKSSHFFEGTVGYDFGFLAVNWSTTFAGQDGTNKSGDRAYGSYLQLDAPFQLAKINWTASLGVVPYYTNFYAADQSSGFHINQIALRGDYEIEFPHFKLPVFGQLMANPSSRNLYYCFGIRLKAL